MYRNHGIALAFGIENDNADNETKKLGELVALNGNAEAVIDVTGTEGLIFPLICDVQEDDKDASVTVQGVAKVFVEDAAGIVVGSEVGVGTTGKGIELFTSGYSLGLALATPRGNGDFIPVLLSPKQNSTIY